jgi:transcriptional regulator with XRE-family HTH domain
MRTMSQRKRTAMTPESLAAWRKALGMTQSELAAALGCSRRALTNWEGGIYDVPQYIALACAALAKKLRPVE